MKGYEIRKKDFRVIWKDMKYEKTLLEWYEMIWNTKTRHQSYIKWYEVRKNDFRVIWNDMRYEKKDVRMIWKDMKYEKRTLEWYEIIWNAKNQLQSFMKCEKTTLECNEVIWNTKKGLQSDMKGYEIRKKGL